MNEKLEKLEKLLTDLRNPVLKALEKPLCEVDILNFFKNIKLPPDENIKDLYMWKGGVQASKFFSLEFELFSSGNFLTLSGAVSMYALDQSTDKLFKRTFFPLFFSRTGDKILVDLDTMSNTYGALFIFAPSITLSSGLVLIYDTIESLFDTIIACYEEGAYQVSERGYLLIDFEKEKQISSNINRKSNFWLD